MLTATRPHALAGTGPAATLPELLATIAAQRGEAEVAIDARRRMSFADLDAAAARFAAGLATHGVRRGDVVMTQLPNWWETIVATWGCWKAGAVVIPVVTIYRAHELRFIMEQTRPSLLIAPAFYRGYDHAAELRRLVDQAGDPGTVVVAVREVAPTPGVLPMEQLLDAPAVPVVTPVAGPDEVAAVLYTSGTTSAPKGVLHSHRTLIAECASIKRLCRLTTDDVIFMPSPLSHITGLCYGIILPVDVGCPVVLQDRWEPNVAKDLIERERCTFTVSATPFLRGLHDAYRDTGAGPSALSVFVCGGADIPPDLVRDAHRVLGTAVLRTYGSTEMPTLTMADPTGDLDAEADAEGSVIGDNAMRLQVDAEGSSELLAKGPELFLGYADASLNADAFTEDGYFRTGDAATVDDKGRLRISGRIKDIINRGGEKFSAAEVEWALLGHPAVAEIAIVGYPDPELGERACAFVVPGTVQPTLSMLRAHLLSLGMAVQKSPERLELISAMPRTASGKIQKFQLRQRLIAGPSPSTDIRGSQ